MTEPNRHMPLESRRERSAKSSAIGKKLRERYSSTVDTELPDEFLELLKAAERKREQQS